MSYRRPVKRQQTAPDGASPLRIVGGCLSLVVGIAICVVTIFVGISGLFLSALALGSMGGGLLAKGLVVLGALLATLLVLGIAIFFIVLGIRLLRNTKR